MKIYYKIICFFIIFNLILFMTYSKSYATFTQVNDIESTLSNIINYHLSEASQSEDASNDDINDEDSSYEDVGDDDVTNDEENSNTDVDEDDIDEDDIDDGDSGDDDYIDGDDLDQSFGSSTDDDDEDDGDGDEEDYSDDEDYDEEDGEEDDNSVSISSQQPNVSSSYDLPKTGISSTLIISMLLIALFGIYSFYKFSNQDF